MQARKFFPFLVLLAAFLPVPAQAQAPLPAGWPNRVELGMADGPGGAAAMRATAPFAFRYQYLAGGVNTGNGWANWNPNGDFARFYIQDSVANGVIPVFTYYMIFHSAPGGGSGEAARSSTNLNNTATMTAYYNDLKLFFQKAGAFPGQRVVLHVEPDLWGYMEQRSTNDDARTVPAKVAETGLAELAGLPGNMSGFARAVLKLRDTYAPNVNVGYHISVWGTGIDIALSNPSDATVDALAARAANFYKSLAADFDIAFAEFSDRDSGFYQFVYGDGGQHWLDADDFRRSARFLGGFSAAAGKRIVMWQIPLGNTKMRAHEQHHRALPGQPSRVAARRARPLASGRVPRRGRRGVSLRRRRERHHVRVQRPERRRDESSTHQRQHARFRGGRPGNGACRRSFGEPRRRWSRPTLPTTTAGSSAGRRGSTTRTVRWHFHPEQRQRPRRRRRM